MNLLLVGALPPPIGGTTVLFKQLVQDIPQKCEVRLRVIDISRSKVGGVHDVIHAFRCLALLLWHLPWASVMSFQTSKRGAITFGPIIHIISRLLRRRWIFRGFGGDIHIWHQNSVSLQKQLFDRTVLKADALLFERKTAVEYFKDKCENPVHWYPNNRHSPDVPINLGRSIRGHRRFVFVGHVKPSKGVAEIIEASKILRSRDLSVDVYGPLQEGVTPFWFTDTAVKYCGPLASEDVIETLTRYDVLLLPTYFDGEGYPGIILEAYCAGIPVISTNWGGIPEIVTAETGILVQPRDAIGLANAMRTLIDSDHLLSILRNGVRSKAREFDSERWTQHFIDLCHQLATH
jgi:glycosyltransferase involved in cell wall biosynthesis